MKNLLLSFVFVSFTLAAFSQSPILLIDGEAPNPFDDKSGTNTVINNGITDMGGYLLFPIYDNVAHKYLSIETMEGAFDPNQNWTFECDLKIFNPDEEIAIIDFRSTSSTGNMYFYYHRDGNGLFFSDRNLNGNTGHLVADYSLLPTGTWVNIKLERTQNSLRIYRDGQLTADTAFAQQLSPVATTTIGYSEDRREPHSDFHMDNIKLYGTQTAGVENADPQNPISVYPNPFMNEINLNAGELKYKLEILDLSGKKVYEKNNLTGFNKIETEFLKPGIYFLKLINNNQVYTLRVVKN